MPIFGKSFTINSMHTMIMPNSNLIAICLSAFDSIPHTQMKLRNLALWPRSTLFFSHQELLASLISRGLGKRWMKTFLFQGMEISTG
jgi:hypothetical protein